MIMMWMKRYTGVFVVVGGTLGMVSIPYAIEAALTCRPSLHKIGENSPKSVYPVIDETVS